MKYSGDRASGSHGDHGGRLAIESSVHRDNRINCAYLKVWEGQVKLNVNRNSDKANPNYGSLRFRRKFPCPFHTGIRSRY